MIRAGSGPSEDRPGPALRAGVTPITGQHFDMNVMKATVYSMVRKSNAKNLPISKDEAKEISALLKYLMDESVR